MDHTKNLERPFNLPTSVVGGRLWIKHPSFLPDPPDEWFDLEVDNDIDPMKMFEARWLHASKYLGPKFSGKQTYRVKLISLGWVQNLKEATKKAQKENRNYRLLEGQALPVFATKFSNRFELLKYNILFGGSEWEARFGSPEWRCFGNSIAELTSQDKGAWNPGFCLTRSGLGDWRNQNLWAVVEQG